MLQLLSKSFWLLCFFIVVLCGLYPLALWIIGQIFFPFQANGSLLFDAKHTLIGSQLIAQPFHRAEYFQPRPSAAAYNAAASASSALSASNYALRDRAARTLSTVATYSDGKPVAPDIEAWFHQDQYQGRPHLVAQWASLHPRLAQNWATADTSQRVLIDEWVKTHPAEIAQFIKDHPDITTPQAPDLAVAYFIYFSKEHPGAFPSSQNTTAIFFDMWRQDHPNVALNPVPGDWVTTSASGLDPHISLQNAEFQLGRVAAEWAFRLKRDPDQIKNEIEALLQKQAKAPFRGLFGEKLINVLEINLALNHQYASQVTQ